jgi:hypothetical protein
MTATAIIKVEASKGRRWRADTSDPGIIPDGIRDRANRAARMRGPQAEDKAKTRASKAYWIEEQGD